jgi:hypothetical protein
VAFHEVDVTTSPIYSKLGYILVDLLFIFDIVVNFLSAYEVPGNTYEIRMNILARDYLVSWFCVDFLAAFPVDILALMAYGNSDSPLPRTYKAIRILRIFKILKLSKYKANFNKALARFKLSAGTNRIATFIILAIFIVHLIACLWFMQARY